jgi:hypothetical protein
MHLRAQSKDISISLHQRYLRLMMVIFAVLHTQSIYLLRQFLQVSKVQLKRTPTSFMMILSLLGELHMQVQWVNAVALLLDIVDQA